MIGALITRGLTMIFGYAYPAYECYKTVETNEPEIEQLHYWCQYWILVAMLTVFERFSDSFISWFPFYNEAKLAFFIYLWHPKTKGANHVYDSFFRPYISKHEPKIDRSLSEFKLKANDVASLYLQRAATYFQTRMSNIFLQFAHNQSKTHTAPKSNEEEEAKAK